MKVIQVQINQCYQNKKKNQFVKFGNQKKLKNGEEEIKQLEKEEISKTGKEHN